MTWKIFPRISPEDHLVLYGTQLLPLPQYDWQMVNPEPRGLQRLERFGRAVKIQCKSFLIPFSYYGRFTFAVQQICARPGGRISRFELLLPPEVSHRTIPPASLWVYAFTSNWLLGPSFQMSLFNIVKPPSEGSFTYILLPIYDLLHLKQSPGDSAQLSYFFRTLFLGPRLW